MVLADAGQLPTQLERREDPRPARRPVGHVGIRVDVREHPAWQGNGFVAVGVVVALAAAAALWTAGPVGIAVGVLAVLAAGIVAASIAVIQPGQTLVVQFFGDYVGTIRRTGLVWVRPLTLRRAVSIRVRNFEPIS